jgi:prephenate dehydratase
VTRIGFLGPSGTFTELAARSLPEAAVAELVPFHTVLAALDAVREGSLDHAMVAFENSVEGSVPISLDGLATGTPLVIVREVVIPVSFALLVRPGTTLDAIATVAAHPHAEPQCRRWLSEHLPRVEWEPAASNADAAQAVSEGRWDAALAGAFAAPLYGLEVLADGIHDVAGAVTRFVLVSRPVAPPAPTGADKTTLVLYPREDHPGGLLEILTEFAVRGINLVRLESRPTGDGLGKYCFSVDAEGHLDDARMGEALMGLRRVCADVRFLGSYPQAVQDRAAPTVPPQVTDQAFAGARRWLEDLRSGGTGPID